MNEKPDPPIEVKPDAPQITEMRYKLWQCPMCGESHYEGEDVYANVFCTCGTEMGYVDKSPASQ